MWSKKIPVNLSDFIKMQIVKKPIVLSLALTLPLVVSACGGGGGDETADVAGEKTVTVLGVVVGEQQEKLEAALQPFEDETGIDVIYEGTDSFATLLPVRAESGDAPDVAMFPQPGLMQSFASAGQLVPITDFIDEATLAEAYPETWISLATFDDATYGIWYRASVKSLVWYNPQAFEASGYWWPRAAVIQP